MNSPLDSLNETFEVVIIGGGIVGAGIFRDLSLHGVNCLLVDKKDFSSQTSGSSSKMLHGGIRYLENLDFALVWEALHEKNLWLRIAPHLCYERPFHFPVYEDSPRPLWLVRFGLILYDYLSNFLNTPHTILNSSEINQKFPTLNKEGLKGVGVYHDVVVDDAKLTLEVIYDALVNTQCQAVNYVELAAFKHFENYSEVVLRDNLIPNKTKKIKAKYIVFATGPFTDKILEKLKAFPWNKKLLPSKGSHIWLKKESLKIEEPMVLTTPDKRIIFTIPRKEAILVGTTEVKPDENFFDPNPGIDEIEYLLKTINNYFPDEKVDKNSILSSYSGIRPLVMEENGKDMGKTARTHKTFYPFNNVFVIIGGKYTTFRVMGQEITRNILSKLDRIYNKDQTESPLRKRSEIISFLPSSEKLKLLSDERITKILKGEMVRTFEDLVKRRIGIPNKNHWITPIPFDQFFIEKLGLIKKFIPLKKEDILNF